MLRAPGHSVTPPFPVHGARARDTNIALLARALQVGATIVAVLVPGLCVGLARIAIGDREGGSRHLYRQVRLLLTRLGPTFVKAGQVLGTRRDIFPAVLCDELSLLTDSVRPLDSAGTSNGLREAYGGDLDSTFQHIDPRPVASGSVACVYRGTLPSGRDVAIKLRRPGIEPVMRRDLALMRRGAALAARMPVLRGVPVTEVATAMCDAVLSQLDFAREADSLIRLRDNLSEVPRIWVPLVHQTESRPRSIVMEFIPDLDIRSAGRCPAAVQRRLAASALTAIYHMLFIDGFVHCDLHPGNLYFTRAGEAVVLDAGFSIQLSARLQRLFAEFFFNMAVGRGVRCAEIVIESSAAVSKTADRDGFIQRMAQLVERSHGLSAKEFSLIAFSAEMFDLQRKHGIHAAPELIFPLLSLLVIEGAIRDLDPEIDFQEVARPVLNRGLFGR